MDSLRIYIADDDVSITQYLENVIRAWARNKGSVQSQLFIANAPEELNEKIAASCDLIILDIVIGEENGIDFAKGLRMDGCDSMIAFISSHNEFAISGYSAHAISYLLKPLKENEVVELLDQALLSNGDFSAKALRFPHNNKSIYITIRSIRYIQASGNYVDFYLKDKSDPVNDERQRYYLSMHDIELLSTGTSLVRCHRGYFVNIDYIDQLIGTKIVLDNGEILWASKRYLRQVRQSLLFSKPSEGE